jgi:hypothetical protein
MRFILLFVGGMVLANIIGATFFMRPMAQEKAQEKKTYTTVNSATAKGQDPWMANERYNAPGRDIARKSTLEALGRPYASFCTPEGHKHLVETINHYYWQRHSQEQSYANTYGEEARRYAVKAWQSTDDNRIERLVGEIYGRGYLALEELRPYARAPMAALVKGTRVSGKPCAA